VRYLLISRGFYFVEALVLLAGLSFLLTGSRIVAIDRLGDRADMVASVIVTVVTVTLLRAVNRRVMVAIDRRFFREAYDAQVILTGLSEAVRTFSKTEELLEVVAAKIMDALHPENITILIEDDASGDLKLEFSSGNAATKTESGDLPFPLVLPRYGRAIDRKNKQMLPTATEILPGGELKDASPAGGVSTPFVIDSEALQTLHPARLIPISSKDHLYGIISLGQRLGDLPYSEEDEQLLFVIAGQIAGVIENMNLIKRMAEEERIKRELEMAAEVQRHLFPAGALEGATFEMYGMCLPARGVGGDYYDYFEVSDHLIAIAIADVAGKGIAAALLMSTVQALLRSQLISDDRSLTDVVSQMNGLLRRSTGEGGYVTFFLAEFDEQTRELTYVNAGHNPTMLVRRGSVLRAREAARLHGPASFRPYGDVDGRDRAIAVRDKEEEARITLLTTGGPIIGTFLDGPFEQETIHTESGDALVAYTDGVTEALSPEGIEFGEERLRTIILESLHLTAREMVGRIIAKVGEWQSDAPQHDDMTLIVAKFK
jgi:sigma-B regulation protein RsbU (phosphoserine phosphatase)